MPKMKYFIIGWDQLWSKISILTQTFGLELKSARLHVTIPIKMKMTDHQKKQNWRCPSYFAAHAFRDLSSDLILFGIWQLRKKMCLIIINIMLIAELERCGEELLINSQSKVITRNFHGFFQIRYQYIRNRVLASLKIEKLLELQKILPSRKEKLSLYKKE